jgi:hypothetical protein
LPGQCGAAGVLGVVIVGGAESLDVHNVMSAGVEFGEIEIVANT